MSSDQGENLEDFHDYHEHEELECLRSAPQNTVPKPVLGEDTDDLQKTPRPTTGVSMVCSAEDGEELCSGRTSAKNTTCTNMKHDSCHFQLFRHLRLTENRERRTR